MAWTHQLRYHPHPHPEMLTYSNINLMCELLECMKELIIRDWSCENLISGFEYLGQEQDIREEFRGMSSHDTLQKALKQTNNSCNGHYVGEANWTKVYTE